MIAVVGWLTSRPTISNSFSKSNADEKKKNVDEKKKKIDDKKKKKKVDEKMQSVRSRTRA